MLYMEEKGSNEYKYIKYEIIDLKRYTIHTINNKIFKEM